MPKALKSRERVPAMANPHKSSRERERVGIGKKNKTSPEGSELKKLRGNAGVAGTGKVFQLRINANLREENFKSASRKARSRNESNCGEKVFGEAVPSNARWNHF